VKESSIISQPTPTACPVFSARRCGWFSAPAFSIERYNDPAYRHWLENWRPTGQL
jgi:hypothetical protein